MLGFRRALALALALLLYATAAAAACPQASTATIASLKQSDAHGGGELIVDGVVTGAFLGADRLNGFYLQATAADGPVGIFVYVPRVPAREAKLITPGSHIQLHARAGEFRGQRQLQRVSRVELCARERMPPPLALRWPVSEARLGRLEGVLVQFPQPLTVTGNYELARYGTLKLAAERLFRPTNDQRPPARRDILLLDDGSHRRYPEPIPYLDDDGSRRVGSRVEGLTGVIAYAFGDYRLHPTEPPRFQAANPRPGPLPPPEANLRVVAYNVENYFLSLGQRGAANREQLALQRAKLAAAVAGLGADVLALSEVENDPRALQDLLEHLNAAIDHPPYRAVRGRATSGSDAIKLALLYRPDRVEALSPAYADGDPVHNRPPLAAFFRPVGGGEPFGVATAHFKSKTRCPSSGDIDRGQGCWNLRRSEQAQAMRRFLQGLQEDYGVPAMLVIGDLNSYGAEDPIRLLRTAGLTDLLAAQLPPERRYTYVFRGESGYLDHALASAALLPRVQKAQVWHINADEPRFLGYDGAASGARWRRPDPYRSSDHDPVVVDLKPVPGGG